MYMQGKNQGLGSLGDTSIDWNSILKDVVGGYTAYKSVQTQADIAKMQMQQQQQAQALQQQQAQRLLSYQLNPQYSGAYVSPTSASSNMMPILLIGGAAVLLLMLMKG